MTARPVIAVSACRRVIDPHPFHMVGEKYLTALIDVAGALPWMVPALPGELPVDELLERIDGLFLTGSYSNVEPQYYGGEPSRPDTLHDASRDAMILPLIRRAVAAGIPLFAACRGLQEVNVALGGSLHQHVCEVGPFDDHRENPEDPLDEQYGPSHGVNITVGGFLHRVTGMTTATVNSVHGQGINRLAEGVTIEALAEDGLIEAFSIDAHPDFALAVQWHPEWRAQENPLSSSLFRAFGDAARRYAAERPARQQTDSLLSALGTAGDP